MFKNLIIGGAIIFMAQLVFSALLENRGQTTFNYAFTDGLGRIER